MCVSVCVHRERAPSCGVRGWPLACGAPCALCLHGICARPSAHAHIGTRASCDVRDVRNVRDVRDVCDGYLHPHRQPCKSRTFLSLQETHTVPDARSGASSVMWAMCAMHALCASELCAMRVLRASKRASERMRNVRDVRDVRDSLCMMWDVLDGYSRDVGDAVNVPRTPHTHIVAEAVPPRASRTSRIHLLGHMARTETTSYTQH